MTGAELVAASLRILSVLAENESPSAEQAKQHIGTLNDLLAQWRADGSDLGFNALQTPSDTVQLPDWAFRAVKFNLAKSLSVEYAKQPDPLTIEIADRGRDFIAKMCAQDPIIDTKDMPQGRPYWWFNVNTG